MKERIAHVWGPHTNPNGEPKWPADQQACNELASRVLGACIVAGMDGWIESAIDVLSNPTASPERLRSRTEPELDDERRRVFGSLTTQQREQVEALLFRSIKGAVFSILVKLDQFPGGLADVVVTDPDHDGRLASVMEGSILDLHYRLHEWVAEFSEYPERY